MSLFSNPVHSQSRRSHFRALMLWFSLFLPATAFSSEEPERYAYDCAAKGEGRPIGGKYDPVRKIHLNHFCDCHGLRYPPNDDANPCLTEFRKQAKSARIAPVPAPSDTVSRQSEVCADCGISKLPEAAPTGERKFPRPKLVTRRKILAIYDYHLPEYGHENLVRDAENRMHEQRKESFLRLKAHARSKGSRLFLQVEFLSNLKEFRELTTSFKEIFGRDLPTHGLRISRPLKAVPFKPGKPFPNKNGLWGSTLIYHATLYEVSETPADSSVTPRP